MSLHTLSVLVEDKPGVLSRVSGLFSRRMFNIASLAVGPTEVPKVSRITIVADGDSETLEQLTKQLNKLIHVLKVVELLPETSRLATALEVINRLADYLKLKRPDLLGGFLEVLEDFGAELERELK